ncbi:MAG: methyltransferase domain-containing protein [Ferruginibacter sp.]
MEVKRRKLQGVLNILSFNRHFYIAGLGILALLLASRIFIEWPASLFWIVLAAFLYGFTAPLIVSAYVYDLSGYYEFDWLKKVIKDNKVVKSITNINAGFDETSFIIESKFPSAEIKVFDFYDAARHTEPAIKRARKVSITYPGTATIQTGSIPLESNSVDIVFLLSAAHEIRSYNEKVTFLKECRRICKPGGKVIMVEHLRDLPNFLAFTVGFTHFFSRQHWKKAFTHAGFQDLEETKFTAFMSIFECST